MEEAASKLAYEQAARLRDQIQMLKQIQATQVMTRMSGHDIDAVGIAHQVARSSSALRSSTCGVDATWVARTTSPRGVSVTRTKCSRASWRSTILRARRRPRSCCHVRSKAPLRSSRRSRRRPCSGFRLVDSQQRSRHPRTLDRDGPQQRSARPEDARVEPCDGCGPARCRRARAKPRQDAAAHRMLRRQPLDGRVGGRFCVLGLKPAEAHHAGFNLRNITPGD